MLDGNSREAILLKELNDITELAIPGAWIESVASDISEPCLNLVISPPLIFLSVVLCSDNFNSWSKSCESADFSLNTFLTCSTFFGSSSENPIETDLAPTFLPNSLHFSMNSSRANSLACSGLDALASPNSDLNESELTP